MSDIIKRTNESGAAARSNRRFLQGRVVAVNRLNHTCRIDVGATLPNGAIQYLEDVPYTPQTPPVVNAVVDLTYANDSPHSVRVAATGTGGPNSDEDIEIVGGVISLRKTGEATRLKGHLELEAGSGVTLTQNNAAKKITIAAAGAAPGDTTPLLVDASAAVGVSADYAREDHEHRLGVVTTKGDILVHNGTDPARLAVGTNGQILSANSSAPTGLEWIDPPSGGEGDAPADAQYVVLALHSALANERRLQAVGAQLQDNGANNDVVIAVPFYRMRAYTESVASATYIDGSYFGAGSNKPAGATERAFTIYCSGPGGSFFWQGYGGFWVVWLRMKIRNAGASAVSLNFWPLHADDSLGIYIEAPSPLHGGIDSNNTTALSGVPIGSTPTQFLTDYAVGDCIVINNIPYRITAIADDFNMTVQGNVPTGSAQLHRKAKLVYANVGGNNDLDNDSGVYSLPSNEEHTVHVFAHNNLAEMMLGFGTDMLEAANVKFIDFGV